MVTTKSGKFKGFAYVEYSDSNSAKRAILELNDTLVGDRKMSVAISNPPGKSASQKHADTSLMPEKAEEGTKRKMKMNFMIPRAISKPKSKQTDDTKVDSKAAASRKDNKNSAPIQSSSSSGEVPKQMLSNSEFSKLFYK
jgi:RNA recognition motif-containing protein